MKLQDFKIGETFFGSAGYEWLCTDIGTRTITAIMLEPDKEDYWFKGPPYSVEEKVFDEHEIQALYTNTKDMLLDRVNDLEASAHPNFLSDDVFKMMKDPDRKYPRKKILTRDRVSKEGYILHPYAAKRKDDKWYIKTFEIFSRQYSEMLDDEFVQLKYSTEEDMKKRKQVFLSNT